MGDKPRVFISYAHKDAWDFTQRLAFALQLYLGGGNVFWDQALRPRPFPAQLKEEIESRNFFIAVMSPYSQRPKSLGGWCRKELKIALDSDKEILPVRFTDHDDRLLIKKWNRQYASFHEDFDKGFRQLTDWILGDPRSSWEYICFETNQNIVLEHLRQGQIPGIIAKEIGEWLIVDKSWAYIREKLITATNLRIFMGDPRTPEDILEQLPVILKQLASQNQWVLKWQVEKTQETIQPYVDNGKSIRDIDHVQAAQNTSAVIDAIWHFFQYTKTENAFEGENRTRHLHKDVASKIRELILMHSRRSRYLY
jgi:hypothetical protein